MTIKRSFSVALGAIALSAGVLLSSGIAFAGTHDPNVNTRQAKQHARIHNGVKSGELTKKEAVGLRAEQRHLRRAEHRMKADGDLTAEERAKLQKMENKTSKHIYNQKHDEQARKD